MIAGSSSCLYCLKVLSREEEKKEVSLRKSSLASAAEEGCWCWKMLQGKALHRKETFSLQQLLKPETKQLSPTHLYSECSQKCPKTITQILQPGRQEYLAKMENLNQAWYKHLCGVQLQLNLCRPVSQNYICNESFKYPEWRGKMILWSSLFKFVYILMFDIFDCIIKAGQLEYNLPSGESRSRGVRPRRLPRSCSSQRRLHRNSLVWFRTGSLKLENWCNERIATFLHKHWDLVKSNLFARRWCNLVICRENNCLFSKPQQTFVWDNGHHAIFWGNGGEGNRSCQDHVILTFILVTCSNRENGVLDVFVLVNLGLVQVLVKVRRVVVLVRDSNPDELWYWGKNELFW